MLTFGTCSSTLIPPPLHPIPVQFPCLPSYFVPKNRRNDLVSYRVSFSKRKTQVVDRSLTNASTNRSELCLLYQTFFSVGTEPCLILIHYSFKRDRTKAKTFFFFFFPNTDVAEKLGMLLVGFQGSA